MALSKDIKEFVEAFSGGVRLWNDVEYKRAMMAYYKALTAKASRDGKGSTPDVDGHVKEETERRRKEMSGAIPAPPKEASDVPAPPVPTSGDVPLPPPRPSAFNTDEEDEASLGALPVG